MQYKEINVPSSEILSICEKVLPEIESSYLVCEEIKKDRREKLQQFRTAESSKFQRYQEIHGYEKSKKHEHYNHIMYASVCKSYNEYYNPLDKVYNSVKSLMAGAKLTEAVKMDQEQVDKLLALKDFDPKPATQAWVVEEPDLTSKFCDEDFVVIQPEEPKKIVPPPTTETRKISSTEDDNYSLKAAIIVLVVLCAVFIFHVL